MSPQEGPEVCESGLWVDEEGNVVDHPVTGHQLVPPGGVMRPDRVRAVEAARALAPVPTDQTDPEPPVPVKVPAAKKASK